MTNVKDFIKYLETLPPETEVRVCQAEAGSYGTSVGFVPLDLSEATSNIEFTDLTDNPFVKDDSPLKNKKYLEIGEDL